MSSPLARAAHQVLNISARTIGVAYRPVENPGDSMFYDMELPKQVCYYHNLCVCRSLLTNSYFSSSKASEQAKVTQVSYLGMGNPQRTSLYHFGKYVNHTISFIGPIHLCFRARSNSHTHANHCRVKDWGLLMVGGSNFAEIEVLSTASTASTDEQLDPLSLNDSFRAQVPMRAEGTHRQLRPFTCVLLL